MIKKILYAIVIIIIIVILAIMWKDSKKEEVIPINTSDQINQEVQPESNTSISGNINSINVDSGIDNDLNSMDADIKTL